MQAQKIIPPDSTFSFVVEHPDEGMRLDIFVSQQFPHYSRSFFKVMIANERVIVNQKVAHKSGVILKAGDMVTVTFPPQRTHYEYDKKELDALGVEIVFKHEDFLIIYKPAGLLVHPPSERCAELSLTDWLVGFYQDTRNVGYTDRPGIVHRLDKNTSGIMIVALTNAGHQAFSNMFRNREIQKTYYAIVAGHPEKEGSFDNHIGRHPTIRYRMSCPLEGRESLTHYKVVEYFDEYSLVEVKPVTGRTHQIRVHFAHNNHPLLGDGLYKSNSKLINRHALHAQKLAFTYDGKEYEFEKERPEDFNKVVEKLQATKTK